jgi:hypothetical protein
MWAMKKIFLLLMMIIPGLSWAQSSRVDMHQPIAKVIRRANCYLKVLERPITIHRGEYAGYSDGLMFATPTTSRRDRVIPVNRVMRITGKMNEYQLKITDRLVTTACVSVNGRDCADLNDITFRDLERISGRNVRISCHHSLFPPFL